MNLKIAAVFLAINLVLPLGLVLRAEAESPPINSAGAAQEYFLAVSLPSKDRLALMSYTPITIGGEVLGGLAAYDDITTARPGDYLELYNKAGDLLAVSWLDAFGIERLAVDRALVEEAGQLQGLFVLLISGHSA
jgi:hypothetical protein